jgi:hypothetical protein
MIFTFSPAITPATAAAALKGGAGSAIAYGNGTFVFVGGSDLLRYFSDGSDWSEGSHPHHTLSKVGTSSVHFIYYLIMTMGTT